MDSREVILIHPIAGEKIESMTKELQTIRAKVEVLREALRTVYSDLEKAKPSRDTMTNIREALATYDKLSEVKHEAT